MRARATQSFVLDYQQLETVRGKLPAVYGRQNCPRASVDHSPNVVYKSVQELKKDNKTENSYVYTTQSQFLGNTNGTNFSKDGRSITYNNLPSHTTISLICAQSPDKFWVPSLDEQDPNSLDGWVFMRNGFKVLPRDRPATGQDPNSYDSI
ncbi:hypothetical protein EVAR_26471_1 [Eumeta japonica]|uniref:Uncharacterized protein n=1 Tax=Eumeta variegata TaxID=151549 RepID=A0A4C1V910_EUMVA|nr:hypothetical protein EVAR_26471_1 [Eumeta japonica]